MKKFITKVLQRVADTIYKDLEYTLEVKSWRMFDMFYNTGVTLLLYATYYDIELN